MKALDILESLQIAIFDANIKNTSVKFLNTHVEDIQEAIAELEELQNRSCENCKHCDAVYENIIHCQNFEELLPKEIGKCDMYIKNDKQ